MFACKEIEYLGHIVGLGKIKPMELKVKSLLETSKPQTKKQLQSFLGVAGFYQRYLPFYSQMTAPLSELLKKSRKFVWADKEVKAFYEIKKFMSMFPVLKIADFDKPFVLFVDASDIAVGSVLMQKDDVDEVYKPVCYFSKKLNKFQVNYGITDKEALVLIFSIRALRIYLSKHTIVYTDHEPLKFIHSNAIRSQRLLRWSMELQSFDLEIKHISASKNILLII